MRPYYEQPQVFEKACVSSFDGKILTLKERNQLHDRWTLKRLETILPQVMQRENIDMWVIPSYEHNEDPVMLTMVPSTMMMGGHYTARRRTILIFNKKADGTVERLAIVRPMTGIETFFENVWVNPKGANWTHANPHDNVDFIEGNRTIPPETEYECLARIIRERAPRTIGINNSAINAYAAGLSQAEYVFFMDCLPKGYKERVVCAEKLAIGWLESRLKEEIYAYNGVMQLDMAVIAEAFSSRVVHPCITTCEDVEWWIVNRFMDMKIIGGAHVNIYRKGVGSLWGDTVILPGDLLHCDISYNYLGLCADVQDNAYVLKWDEEEAPADICRLFDTANRFQDIFATCFVTGRTGNEILADARQKTAAAGIDCRIFTHPIGYHIHAAGPTIGLFDMQDGVPGNGEVFTLHDDTCYSMEFTVTEDVPSWGERMAMGFEVNVAYTEGQIYYMGGRQSKPHLIK